ncbi:MAG: YmdB family metallophosphoesterase, partial [Candidatus Omnitrophica bacterium]|nr:YmdB family metallophosphoesterase [Candidatus Omnitrophota bacterium]
MKILFIGDIVGNSGREAFSKFVPVMKATGEVDLVVANAENAAGGSGITERVAEDLFAAGCDVITLGDHVWDKKDTVPYLVKEPRILRPANFPAEAPGHGSCIVVGPGGVNVGVITLMGRTFMKLLTNCPFRALEVELAAMSGKAAIVLVDMHAEATSEKVAMGWFSDGKVSAVCGTHTHIQTADEKVLPNGTAY